VKTVQSYWTNHLQVLSRDERCLGYCSAEMLSSELSLKEIEAGSAKGLVLCAGAKSLAQQRALEQVLALRLSPVPAGSVPWASLASWTA